MIIIRYGDGQRLVIDAALSEEHTLDSEVTQFPVEDGADITDNIRPLPKVVTIEGIVSNTSLGRAAAERAGVNALIEEGLIEPSTASGEALVGLQAIYDGRKPVMITSSLGIYENMAMESLSIPRDASTGDALRFSVTFRQVVVVQRKRVTVRVSVPRGSAKKTVGAQPVQELPPSTMRRCLKHQIKPVEAGNPLKGFAEICTEYEAIYFDPNANGGRGAYFEQQGGAPLDDVDVRLLNNEIERNTDVTYDKRGIPYKNGKPVTWDVSEQERLTDIYTLGLGTGKPR